MPFNFNARYALLTYAQCDGLGEWEVLDHISSLQGECIIGRELHEDGGTHLHVFVDFGRKHHIRRHDAFDVQGYHPNIVPSWGTPEKGWDYATKDGDIVAGGLERPGPGENVAVKASAIAFGRIADAVTIEEFWSLARDLEPRALLCNFGNFQRYAEWKFRVVVEEYEHPDSVFLSTGNVPQLDEWVHGNIGRPIGGKLRPARLPAASRLRGILRSIQSQWSRAFC